MVKKVEKSDKKKVEKFKADYAGIKAKVKLIKQKLRELRKEVKPISKAAWKLFERGDKTMYNEMNKGKRHLIEPKFDGLERIMEDLEAWMEFDGNIQDVIESTI